MTKRFIGLSGPRNCGKDAFINYLQSCGVKFEVQEAKTHLHKLVQVFFNLSEEDYWNIYENRATKESPLDEFRVTADTYENLCKLLEIEPDYSGRKQVGDKLNLSVREALITVSEIIAKPILGNDVLGQYLATSIRNSDSELFIDGSVAFIEEIPPVIEEVGSENYLLVRIYGRGDFSNDSRNYIPDGVVDNTVDVWNNGTEKQYLDNMYNIIMNFIEKK